MWSPDTIRLKFFRTEKGGCSYIKWIRFRGEIIKLYPGMPRGLFFVDDIVLIKSGRCKGKLGKVYRTFKRLYTDQHCVYVWVKVKPKGKYYYHYRYPDCKLYHL